jgi:hypothetical protein
MTSARRVFAAFAIVMTLAAWTGVRAAEAPVEEPPKVTANLTGFYYAMRDQPDFGVGVAAFDRGALRLEMRYNYEARQATSVFAGWKLAGGDVVTFEITPIGGVLFGQAHAIVPGVEASVGYRVFDAYIEAEYVIDRDNHADSYFYAWSELGWRPVEWLRLGFVGQRTRVVQNDRDLQRGVFAQISFANTTLGLYAFNPDAGSRYEIISVGMRF